MERLLAVFALAGCVASAGCDGLVWSTGSPMTLGAVDAAVLEQARTLTFTFSQETVCQDLVNLSPAELEAQLGEGGEGAPVQHVDPQQLSEHVFGSVPPDTPTAFLVLASAKPVDEPTLGALSGSLFAAGCRDFEAPPGSRHDLPLTLFPVGLR